MLSLHVNLVSFRSGLQAPAWRNWQTRWTQNPVIARSCGFEPLRRQVLGSTLDVGRSAFDVQRYQNDWRRRRMERGALRRPGNLPGFTSRASWTRPSICNDGEAVLLGASAGMATNFAFSARTTHCGAATIYCFCLYESGRTTMFTREREKRPAGCGRSA